MRIAIIGAPGSGKSELGGRLSAHLRIPPVDGYIGRLEKRTGIAFGYLADMVPNLLCATERIKAEYASMQEHGDSYVLCGTTVESAAYIAIRAVEAMNYTDNIGSERQRIQAAIDAATLLLEGWTYDHVFYLALPQSHEDEWDKRLDRSIQEALAMLRIDHTPLTSDDRFEEALAVIEPKEVDEPTQTEE